MFNRELTREFASYAEQQQASPFSEELNSSAIPLQLNSHILPIIPTINSTPIHVNNQSLGGIQNTNYDVTPNQQFRTNNVSVRNHPYKNPRERKEMSTPEILNKILLQTTNISKQTNKNTITQALKDGIKKEGAKEEITSLATITIVKDANYNLETIKQFVNEEWIKKQQQLLPPIWEDKKQNLVYIQFINANTKIAFLKNAKTHPIINNTVNGSQPESKLHYIKKPVRIEISRVREHMNVETIVKTIQTACGNNIKIDNLKEGKLHNGTKTKIVSFQTDGESLSNIVEKMSWKVPYYDASNNIRANLFIKINAKPWLCKDCFAIGNHVCKNKCCGKCGSGDHITKDCNQQEFCNNCRIPGHSAKDGHCQTYLNMLIRNLVQMDIPTQLYNKDHKITNLIDNIQLK